MVRLPIHQISGKIIIKLSLLLLVTKKLSNFSSMSWGPTCLFDHVLHPKSTNLQSRIASLNFSIASTLLSSPPIFWFKFRISLKFPKHSHGSENKPANLLRNVQVCFFWLALGCSYTHTPLYTFPWALWTWKSMWCLINDLIWTAMYVFHMIATLHSSPCYPLQKHSLQLTDYKPF